MTPSLATLLARIGWSDQQAADRLGHHRTTWGAWRTGLRQPPAEILARLQRIAEAIERETVG